MESEFTFGFESPSLKPSYPETTGSALGKEKMKEEVVGLGVELSVSITEAMFLLRDDIVTMLCFCRRLLRYTVPSSSPVVHRLLPVIHSVYTQHIEPKIQQRDDGNISAKWELIKTTWKNFTDGVIVLHRLVFFLRSEDHKCFDDGLLSKAIAKYKQQVVNEIRDKLRDVSEGNGFAREMIESNVYGSWQSLFDEGANEVIPKEMRIEIARKLFPTHVVKSLHREIKSLPIYSPSILGKRFETEEMKEEAGKLGGEISLYVVESMFVVCDDLGSVLRFCRLLWKNSGRHLNPDSSVGERLLRVMYYVYTTHINPKNMVIQRGGKSVHWEIVLSTLESFDVAIRGLDKLALKLRFAGILSEAREITYRVEEAMNKVDEKLRDVKAIAETNGFARDMKPNILELWKAILDETEEPWARKLIKDDMLCEMFPHVPEV